MPMPCPLLYKVHSLKYFIIVTENGLLFYILPRGSQILNHPSLLPKSLVRGQETYWVSHLRAQILVFAALQLLTVEVESLMGRWPQCMPWRAGGSTGSGMQRGDLGRFHLQPYSLGFFIIIIIIIIIIAVLGVEPRVSIHGRQAFYL